MRTPSLSLFQSPDREPPRHSQTARDSAHYQGSHFRREIGPLGTAARLLAGLLLIGLIVYGQLVATRHFTPAAWALGLLGFPALAFVWHWWRIRRNRMPFRETGPVSFLLSLMLPLAVYVTGWAVPALGFASDATILFIGFSLELSALRGSAGCEFLALSNWLLRRHDQIACAVFTPIDSWEQRHAHI
jgi:hypothetical protein